MCLKRAKLTIGGHVMADKTAVFKTHFDLADLTKRKYTHNDLTVAMLPGEDRNHFVLKLLAYCLAEDEHTVFNANRSKHSPDVFIQDVDEHYILWCEVGQPSNKKLLKGLANADKVVVLTVNKDKWFTELEARVRLNPKLHVIEVDESFIAHLADDLSLNLSWSIVIDEKKLSVSVANHYYETELLSQKQERY